MDVDEWIAGEIERLERFREMWKVESAANPEEWPERMPGGEWDEQYRAFETTP